MGVQDVDKFQAIAVQTLLVAQVLSSGYERDAERPVTSSLGWRSTFDLHEHHRPHDVHDSLTLRAAVASPPDVNTPFSTFFCCSF